ncbi:MAG: ABC-type Co2+ transport system permease component [Candidatus Methanohalarchaeum thermophilum]|uniref:Putative cobalt transport protein CbiM n=1 Tax=Methanohalarchaeum thermophilum TaxID=1903181 RepID=A0A1Q6DVJ8_METT1|nr:MAG: ABC-type Co2+ transport system permease component [Candidatus Methanohalarchaeum thermophilum]
MHIAEGFLPLKWSLIWWIVSIPFVAYGIYKVKKINQEKSEIKPLLAISIAFVFIMSAMKFPSVTGSCSHPTGTGLPIVFFGPFVTAFISFIVLLFQGLFLAHGGITTLGANTLSMGIIGPIFGWIAYKIARNAGVSLVSGGFIAAFVADLMTYFVTSAELAAAFPASKGGFLLSLKAFLSIFAVTQIPIAVIEGVAVMTVIKYLSDYGVSIPSSAKTGILSGSGS